MAEKGIELLKAFGKEPTLPATSADFQLKLSYAQFVDVVESALNESHFMYSGTTYPVSIGNDYTYSVFAKKNENNFVQVVMSSVAFSITAYANFDLLNGIIGTVGTGTTAKIESFSDDWYRLSVTHAQTGDGTHNSFIALADSATMSRNASRLGDGTSGVYIYGAQLEQGSYATSYIPTSGQSGGVTRVKDACTNGANEQVINSTEGVFYAEISALANDGTTRAISINDGSTDNFVQIAFRPTTNSIRYRLESGNVVQFSDELLLTDTTTFNKIALVYGNNNFALWSNGVRKLLRTNPSSPINLLNLDFDNGENNSPFYGNVKDIKLYNTVLTDAELQALTTI